MDPRERYYDPQEYLLIALDDRQAQIYTSFPGIIVSVNLAKITCQVQPAIQGIIRTSTGTLQYKQLPLLQDVPLVFMHGGGYSLTFPVVQGDECLVHIANRCIDSWWQSGGVQKPMDWRMHDLSDGFALVGPYSQPKVISTISSTTTQLRSDDGTIFLEIDKPNNKVKVNAATLEVTGQIQCHGEVIGNLGGGQVLLTQHVHSVPAQPGSGVISDVPTPGT